jgi:hypothetical protein
MEKKWKCNAYICDDMVANCLSRHDQIVCHCWIVFHYSL